jgi:glucose/arabinose dehydrogenase
MKRHTPGAETHAGPSLLVANSGSSGVQRFDAGSGRFLGTLVAPDAKTLPFPDTIIAGPDGYLYISGGCRATPDVVCDAGLSVIRKYDPATGQPLGIVASAATSPLYRPYGMAFGPDGLLYAASLMNNKILRYDSAGRFVDEFASGDGRDPAGLNGPNGLAFDGSRYLYVTTEGSAPVDGKPTFPAAFRSVLLRYDVTTREQTLIANPPDRNGTQPSLESIRFGPDGRLFVSDFSLNIVTIFDVAKGEVVAELSTLLPGEGPAEPYTGGIAFDPYGRLLAVTGSNTEPMPGTILRFSGDRYETREVLAGPTERVVRPGGILLH